MTSPGRPRPGRPGFGAGARWLVLAIVLVAAVAVAVWPRGGNSSSNAATPTIDVQTPDIATVRAQAALTPCPATPSVALTALTRSTVNCAANGATVEFGSVLAPTAPTLVNVWAFWCEACKTELPVLQQYEATQGAVRVITLMVQSPEADGLQTLADLHVHLPTVVDVSGAASKALKLPIGLPASYLVRPDGTATLIDSLRTFSTVDQVRTAVSQTEGGQ